MCRRGSFCLSLVSASMATCEPLKMFALFFWQNSTSIDVEIVVLILVDCH